MPDRVPFDPTVPGPPEVENMWLVRAAKMIASRRVPLALMIIGLFFLLASLGTAAAAYRHKQFTIYKIDFQSQYAQSSSSHSGGFSLTDSMPNHTAMMVMTMLGGALTAFGLLWMLRRFSLRWLLGAVLIIGVLGAIQMNAPHGAKRTASIKVDNPDKLITQEQLAEIARKLVPDSALSTLPDSYRKQLSPLPRAGISGAEIRRTDNGVTIEIDSTQDMSNGEWERVAEFYDWYAQYLLLKCAEDNHLKFATTTAQLSASGEFQNFRAEWIARQSKQ